MRYVVQVSAGDGPVEVRRFVAQLAGRIEEVAASRGLVVGEVAVRGDEEAPFSAEIAVTGDAPAILADEIGTHALVARSPDRGRTSRKRWFAGVSVHPAAEAPAAPAAIDPRDLEVTATTSPGPGGQNVNKTATAVRVLHRPSGFSVRVCDERSRRANLARAVERLAALLAEASDGRRAAADAARRMSHHRLSRGAPVRVYRLGPRGALAI
jgi:protein subunit release factor B